MAEETKEKSKQSKATYKFGQQQLDLKNYIHNIGINLQDYLDKQNWSEGQRNEFLSAYDKYMSGLQQQLNDGQERFITKDDGTITDLTGVLSNIDDDGIDPVGSQYFYNDKGEQITTDDYNTLNKRKQQKYNNFNANRQVASYFNKVGRKLAKVTGAKVPEKVESNNKFDLTKHGFTTYWNRINNPAGGNPDLTPYLDKDPVIDGKRGYSGRLAYLAGQLRDYLKNLETGYDYSDTVYKTEEGYRKKLNDLITELEDGDGWSNEDIIAANQAGISNSFYTPFFTNEENPNVTAADKAEIEKAEQDKLLKEAQAKFIEESIQKYKVNNYTYHRDNMYNAGFIDPKIWTPAGGFNGDAYRLEFPGYNTGDIKNFITKYLVNPFNPNAPKALAGLIGSGMAKQISAGDFAGMYYIPTQFNRNKNTALVYDPNTGQLFYTFLGDIPEEWEHMKKRFNIAKGYLKPTDIYQFEQGGTVQIFQWGGNAEAFDYDTWLMNDRQKEIEKRAAANNVTAKQQEAGERQIGTVFHDAEQNAQNLNAEFTDVEWSRIGASIADITSAISAFIPTVGTAVSAVTGVGSTFANLYADANDDSLTGWDVTKNFFTNLGMDALGLIPGGGVASKTTKILRSVGKLLPKVLAASALWSGLTNGKEITNSISKAINTPKELTVNDWNNISQAFQLITGGVTYGGRKYRQYKDNKIPKKTDFVAVEMVDKAGNKKVVAFDGQDAEAIRAAQKNNDVEALRNATTKKYEDLKDLDVNFDTHYGSQWIRANGQWQYPIGKKQGDLRVFDVKQNPDGTLYANRNFYTADDVNLAQPTQRTTIAEVDAAVAKRQQDIVDDLLAGSKHQEGFYNKVRDYASRNQQKVDDLQRQRSNINTDALDSKIQEIYTNRKGTGTTADYEFYQRQTKLVSDEANLTSKKQRKTDLETKQDRTDLEQQELDNLNNEIPALENSINAQKQWLQENSEDAVQQLQDQLNHAGDLDSKITKYNKQLAKARRLQQEWDSGQRRSNQYNDFINSHRVGNGPDERIEWDNPHGRARTSYTLNEFNKILKDAGIKFQKGGSLNLKKVRQFSGGGVSNTKSTATWYDDMYNSEAWKNYINKFISGTATDEDIEQFNNLQKSWKNNFNTVGYVPGQSSTIKNQEVYNRQGLYNPTGLNAAIEQAVKSGRLIRRGNTGDNAAGGWRDGYFGEQEYLRHFGSQESWKNNIEALQQFQNTLKNKGLSYDLDEESGMYLLSRADVSPQTDVIPEDTSTKPIIETTKKTTDTNPDGSVGEEDNNESNLGDNKFKLSDLFKNPTITYGLPRALYADRMNRRITDKAIAAEKPYLQDPFEFHRTIKSDLDAEIQGQRSAGQLYNLSSKPLTSDADKQLAMQLDSAVKGLELINQGKAKSNAALRESQELAQAQEKENAKNRYNVSMQNRLTTLQSESNKNKLEQAYLSKKHNIWDTLWQQFEYDAKTEQRELKGKTDAMVESDIKTALKYNLKEYVPDLDDAALEAWNSVMSNSTTVADLKTKDPEGYDKYLEALNRYNDALVQQLRIYYNIPENKWSKVRKWFNTEQEDDMKLEDSETGEKLKSGGKIAGIKAKTADANRFQKGILESIKRNEKVLDRLSKSMYGYIKASIIK